ncbi:MAG TPA: hypothetical protein VN668_16625 [Stellaceae bacterium]|nr:hypothetical protein [Stellaceae bacterium]
MVRAAALSYALLAIEGEMQDDPNRKSERQPSRKADGASTVEISIRRAFLVHMGEQQRQYPTAVTAPRSNERAEAKRR